MLAQTQLLLTPALLHDVSELAAMRGADKNDFAELLVTAGVLTEVERRGSGSLVVENTLDARIVAEGERARLVLGALAREEYAAVARTDRRGERTYAENLGDTVRRLEIDNANVLALRMAHRQDDASDLTPEPGGYARHGLGMSLAMTAEEVWERSRGYWRIRPDADYILPTRLGYAPYLFKVTDWRTASDATNPSDRTARYWAQNGWRVDVASASLIPVGGSAERTISDVDLAIAEKLTSDVVRYPLGIRNPAVWIGRRAASAIRDRAIALP
ncbi:hypothetical protein [Cryobacterium sp. N19]|uniref:hypothetical protein n=1 Tax=Cryobacterium sp. N19 TaxID=2048288 RepID=UPI000CE307F1|nr:hypothetical protein [Cryobacterium sp. N19]